MATAAPAATGKVIQITGPVVDIEFPAGHLPGIYNAVEILREGQEPLVCEVQQHLGNNWVRAVAMTTTDGLARGVDVRDTGAPITVPVGESTLGRVFDVLGHPIDGKGPVDAEVHAADPPRPARVRPAVDRDRGLRDRAQGHRPDLPVQEGRQDRHLRRGRRRQDGHHPGADPERRPGARRRVRVRRRRRAQPRGQRPDRRDDRVRRHRQDSVRLRPDERAARRPPAGRPDRPDDGRVLPRRGAPRRPPVHRQHLPLHPGGLRGVGAARPHAVRGRLPAEPRDRDGRAPGADHVDPRRLDHLAPGRVRAGRRLHRPGAGDDLRPPRLDDPSRAEHRRARHLPGGRPADLDVARPRPERRRPGALRRRPRDAARPAALPRPPGHHRHPRHRRAVRGGQVDGRPGTPPPAVHEPAVLPTSRRKRSARSSSATRPG